jgi:hypothetical protein
MKGGGLKIDLTRCTVTGKLTKAYKKEGMTFGVLELKMVMIPLSIGEDPQIITFKDGAPMSITMNMDVCIDGTSPKGTVAHATFQGDRVDQRPGWPDIHHDHRRSKNGHRAV